MEYVDVYELRKVTEEYTGSYREFDNYGMNPSGSKVLSRYNDGDKESTGGYVTTSREPVVSFITGTRGDRPPYNYTTTEKLVVMSPLLREVLNYKHIGDDTHRYLEKDNKALDFANRGYVKEIEKLKYEIHPLVSLIRKVEEASWLVRLKWLFTGVKV